MTTEHIDVLIVGAGLSGIGAGYYLQTRCPGKTWTILEARDDIGGTWDLFRYPGIRSDSDMFTLGYTFRPWQGEKAIADGESILNYIKDTAAEYGIDREIRFGHRVCRASWSSAEALWTVDAKQKSSDIVTFTCNFLYMCTGYYSYEAGYLPEWPGYDDYKGTLVHPQKWPENLDYADKKVVVIGSGATAVTLVPAMAEKAGHVTMLQRSPTYIVSRTAEDALANRLRKNLPGRMGYTLARWKSIFEDIFTFWLARNRPEIVKQQILDGVREELGEDYDIEKHFTPSYNPWDQRICLVPDSDLFKAIKAGDVTVVTDEIETFTESGIGLKSGETLEADIIITATGLVMKLMIGVELLVDGQPVQPGDTMTYKGLMYSDIPNLVSTFGYVNASWTLKAELIAEFVCRVLNYMDKQNYQQVTPRITDMSIEEDRDMGGFTSGYIQRGLHMLPAQGSKTPWRAHQNYLRDLFALCYGSLNDGTLAYEKVTQAAPGAKSNSRTMLKSQPESSTG